MTSTVELIIYLEPSNKFKQEVETFLNICQDKYGATTANKYGCHVTMTGFFNVANEEQQNAIKQMVDNLFSNFRTYSPPHVDHNNNFLVFDKTTNVPVHLLLPVVVPDEYLVATSELADACKNVVKLRLKKINHISLAYWDEPEATMQEKQSWHHAVNEKHIFECIQHDASVYFKHVSQPTQWDVVLYRRISKGILPGQRHIFKELGRWHVYR